MRKWFSIKALLIALGFSITLRAAGPGRDFSGKWVLDQVASRIRAFAEVETSLAVSQDEGGIRCSMPGAQWSYALDGSETRIRVGEELRKSIAKWEGSALLIDTLVSGAQSYTVMDRWKLSADGDTLTITRQVVRASGQTEGTLVFRREGAPMAYERPDDRLDVRPDTAPYRVAEAPAPPVFPRRSEPGMAPDLTVPVGTRVLLTLVSEVNTKHAREGDRVYLQTAVPIAVSGQVVIPRGSDVAGTITRTKAAGKVAGKGELFLRFDSLILPNGVSRDFHARPPGTEGQVDGNRKSADGRTVLLGTGMGATIGAITRGLPGAAVGGGVGALAGVLLSRDQNVVLRPGTHVEMVLDRDLVFHPDEIRSMR